MQALKVNPRILSMLYYITNLRGWFVTIQIRLHSVPLSCFTHWEGLFPIFLHSFTLLFLSVFLCDTSAPAPHSGMCLSPALPSTSLWLTGRITSELSGHVPGQTNGESGSDSKGSRRRWHCVLFSKQRIQSFVTVFPCQMLVLTPSGMHWPQRRAWGWAWKAPMSSPSLLLLWVLLSMNGKSRAWEHKGLLIYISAKLFLSPHSL